MKNKIDIYDKNDIEILIAHSSHTFPLHSHESFCLGMVEDGEVTFTIAGEKKTLHRGMVYIIPSDTGVRIETASSYRYIVLCIGGRWKDLLNRDTFRSHYLELSSPETFKKLCAAYIAGSDRTSAQALIRGIMHLMRPVMDSSADQTPITRDNSIVRDACHYIRMHAEEPFDLEQVAAAAHVSRFYLVKLFKKRMGVTPHQYYVQTKLRIVRHRILTACKEADLAAEVGFNDQSHLCNLFKKEMGISLSDFRRHYHETGQ